MIYDVIVIGAGPAGLMATRELADHKLNVLCIDPKSEIGRPLKCGEGIREDGFVELFDSTKYNFVKNRAKGFKVIYKNLERKFEVPFLELDRIAFEKWLAEPIKNKIKLNTKYENILFREKFAFIRTSKGYLKAKLVILCCGTNYQIQQKLGLAKKVLVIPCVGGLYKNHKRNANYFYFYFSEDSLSCLWLFPKNKHLANIGIGALEQQDINETFKQMLKKHKLNPKLVARYAGVYPCLGPIKKTYSDRLLVCGNAAGLVFAGTGEGIYFALKSGKIAARAALEACKANDFSRRFLKRYEKAWKKDLGRQLKAGMIFGDFLAMGYKFDIMGKLFSRPTEEDMKNIVLKGKFPRGTMFVWRMVKLFRLVKPNLEKETIPLRLRFIYWLVGLFNRPSKK